MKLNCFLQRDRSQPRRTKMRSAFCNKGESEIGGEKEGKREGKRGGGEGPSWGRKKEVKDQKVVR